MSRAAAVIGESAAAVVEDLRALGLSQEDVCTLVEIDRGHLSRVKNGKVRPREELTRRLIAVRDERRRQIASAVSILHYCAAGKQRLGEPEKLRAAAAVYSALRVLLTTPLDQLSTLKITANLPEGIDGVIARIGKEPGLPVIAVRPGLEPEQEARVVLHELKEYEKSLRRTLIRGTALALPKAFNPSSK